MRRWRESPAPAPKERTSSSPAGQRKPAQQETEINVAGPGKVRVMIVDDSVVIRKLLSDALNQDPDLEVAGTAGDGKLALIKLPQIKPDLITMDIEMPHMNGLETLAEIRKTDRKTPIIMFSTLTERGAAETLEALGLGASDYATKPSGSRGPAAAFEQIRSELIPKIKALCGRKSLNLAALKPPAAPRKPRPARTRRVEVVAIGVSTGGPQALSSLFPGFPKDLPVPIVMVQHMPPIFTRFLAERLTAQSQIPVAEGSEGARLQPGRAWIAPGNFHMTVARSPAERLLQLNQEAPENSCRPAVDVLFRSVASAYGAGVLGVVMTGMGADGVAGAKHIHDAGGEVIVQDEATSVVWGMPGLVHASGEADGVYPLNQLAGEIVRRVMQGRGAVRPTAVAAHAEEQQIK